MAAVNEHGCCGRKLFFNVIVANAVFIVLLIGFIVYGACNVLDLLECGL